MGDPRDRLLRSALALAQRKTCVLPCVPRGKTPATAHGLKDATTDPATIARWWAETDYNIGIATGRVSGFFVVDVDGDDGEAALCKLETEHGALPASVEVITARGRHIYFRMPPTDIRNSTGKLAPGVDVRGSGGFVIAPPSIHPCGRRYAWSVDCANAIAEAPAWLLARIAPSDGAGGCEAASASEWRQLATDGVAEGKRNDSIARLTGHLLRRYVDPWVAVELVRTWNTARCRPPLADEEIRQIVNSIAGRELKRRQGGGHG